MECHAFSQAPPKLTNFSQIYLVDLACVVEIDEDVGC